MSNQQMQQVNATEDDHMVAIGDIAAPYNSGKPFARAYRDVWRFSARTIVERHPYNVIEVEGA